MASKMSKDIKKVLVSKRKLKGLAKKLGKQISRDYADKNLLVIGVLKGCFITLADILREITVPCRVELIIAKSYGDKTTPDEEVYILNDIDVDFTEYDVLIIEDILDSGNTLSKLKELFLARNPKSFKICTLLDKPEGRRKDSDGNKIDIKADYVGIEIPNEFAVGYGLDFAEKYRNLPYIGVLKKEIYKSADNK